MKLTDRAVKAAQARQDGPYKMPDGGGLHLLVTPAGGKLWRYRYEVRDAEGRREKMLALGTYPAVSLADARRAREEARALLGKGQDPSVEKRTRRAQAAAEAATTFEPIARAWHAMRKSAWSESHARDVMRNLEADVFPALGALPIKAIKPRMVLEMLRGVEERSMTTARKIRQQVSAVFVYAIAEDLAEFDPAQTVGGALRPAEAEEHHPALVSIVELREMLAKVDTQPAYPPGRIAMRLLAITAVRSKELRGAMPAELEELDGPNPIWRIPAERMKGRKGKKREHVVPLAPEAVELFRLAREFAGRGRFLFPSGRSSLLPISENTLNRMLHRAGYEGRHTPHGFRSSFSTIMNERHADSEQDRAIIDLMLAHAPGSGVESIYNRAAYMPRRRELAHEWAALVMEGLSPAASLVALPRSGMGRPAKKR
ncbi:tyrosine-type recombinase/integrase [Roseomonas populi]|uniref:Integrase arm-type DNA-binding domain-containing protein n=1 Tax=Roseomonas populi TaxID=3121582 RepID=A0ABT1X0Z3_9PROT|nr:integrase arm-type DNA-binding domain-containing protein [Roseomonas pecuniae]MCR0981771.1 integrase arm-type DNA-binding domain-containing protein [Roseomonas pecuniae]